jgi:transcriptional regulator with XRE-family HTH domain
MSKSATTDNRPSEERARRLGQAIKRMRDERGIGTKEFSERAGIARSHLWYIEDGRTEPIRLDKFCQIAEALRVTPDDLLREAGYLPATPKSTLPEPEDYMRERYQLTPDGIRQALDFLDFLAARERRLLKESK